MIHFLYVLFQWPNGIVVGNLMASALWALPTWFILLNKLHCAQTLCPRPGKHPVEGTTFHTCQKHTTREVHERLIARHAARFPEQHEYLNGGLESCGSSGEKTSDPHM